MGGDAALGNELVKLWRRPAARVTAGLYLFIAGLGFGSQWHRSRGDPEQAFSLPEDWPDVLVEQAEVLLLFGGVLVILLVAAEFSWRTARQNVIDGVPKDRWFWAKAALVPVTGVLLVGAQVVVGGGFALAGTDLAALSEPLVQPEHVSALGGVLLAYLGYGALALAAAVILRSTGGAMGAWFFYVVLGERLLVGGLGRLGDAWIEAARYLPVQVFNQLFSWSQHSSGARARLAARVAEEGGALPGLWPTEKLAAVAAGWIVLFVVVSFVSFRKRDL